MTETKTLGAEVRISIYASQEEMNYREERLAREISMNLWKELPKSRNSHTTIGISRSEFTDEDGFEPVRVIRYYVDLTAAQQQQVKVFSYEDLPNPLLMRSAVEEVKYRIKSKLRRLFKRTP